MAIQSQDIRGVILRKVVIRPVNCLKKEEK